MARLKASPNVLAFLDMLAQSEIGAQLLAASDDGYNVEVGSTPQHPLLFKDYSDHPRILMVLKSGLKSSAAGRYQFLIHTWDALKESLFLPDFSPLSQDSACVELLRECHALEKIEAGLIPEAVALCAKTWASLPGSPYGQPVHTMDDVIGWFKEALKEYA